MILCVVLQTFMYLYLSTRQDAVPQASKETFKSDKETLNQKNMDNFYTVALVMLFVAIINLGRVLKEKRSGGRTFGIVINGLAIVFLVVALIVKSFL